MATIYELKNARELCKNLNGFENNDFTIEKTKTVGDITICRIRQNGTEKTITALFEGRKVWDTVTNDDEAFEAWVKEAEDSQNK